jgi:hypothetical protein
MSLSLADEMGITGAMVISCRPGAGKRHGTGRSEGNMQGGKD